MNTDEAMIMGFLTQDDEAMVFDWDTAARLIKERQPKVASAGLRDDWEYTGGTIYENGAVVTDDYTFLKSTWAVPELKMDGEVVPCFVMAHETKWNAKTKWPESALKILNREIE